MRVLRTCWRQYAKGRSHIDLVFLPQYPRTLISILLSVQGNHDAIMQKALGKILKEAGFISFNPRNYIGAILIKVLTNYF